GRSRVRPARGGRRPPPPPPPPPAGGPRGDGAAHPPRPPPHLAPGARIARSHEHQGSPQLGRRPEEREREVERRSLLDLALHPELPSVRADDALADVEPEPEPLDPRRPPVVEAGEGAEEPVHVLGGDADPVVGHAQDR